MGFCLPVYGARAVGIKAKMDEQGGVHMNQRTALMWAIVFAVAIAVVFLLTWIFF
jgi:hypothetical protein